MHSLNVCHLMDMSVLSCGKRDIKMLSRWIFYQILSEMMVSKWEVGRKISSFMDENLKCLKHKHIHPTTRGWDRGINAS